MGFSWEVQKFPDGRVGSVATAGPFHLVTTQAMHPDTKEVVGYAFKIIGMQGGGTNFMSCSKTLEEAQARAEFTFTTLLLSSLCVIDKGALEAYIEFVKPMLGQPLEEAMQMAQALEQRNREIYIAAGKKAQTEAAQPKTE